jgi:penicillin-binding protein 2
VANNYEFIFDKFDFYNSQINYEKIKFSFHLKEMRSLFIKREYKKSHEIESDFFSESNCLEAKIKEKGNEFLGKFLSEKKINILLFVFFFGLMILLLRSAYLQIISGSYYQQLAETNRVKEKPLPATRGLIFDSNKTPLVENVPFFDALVLPKDLSLNTSKRAEQIKAISDLLEIEEKQIIEILNKQPENFKYPLIVRENINYDEALLLMIKAKQAPGLYIEIRNQRQYLFSVDFSHILGYQGKISDQELTDKKGQDYLFNDYIGKTGLELSYEPILRGKFGKEGVEVDAAGQEKKVLYYQEPTNGNNLILGIDLRVQQKVREILNNYLLRLNKQKGAVVMENPQNGQILALVSLPDFDDNLFATGISTEDYKKLIENEAQPLFDRAIKGEYPSGSTIKPVVAAGALEEGLITDQTTVNSTGGLRLYDRWFFPDWAAGGHGLTNIYKAISWSVNTYFYMIGGGYEDFKGLGVEGLEKYFKMFGMGEKTGIDLPGEATGLVPNPVWKKQVKNEDWFIGDTYHIAIGQGDILVSPLQIANYTAVFVNGGKLYRPHLVKEIYSNQSQSIIVEPQVLRENFISQENLDIVKKAMRQTVTSGSAQSLNNLNVAVGGKTGTAQWHTEKKPHAWFTGFAPYTNPEVVITVLVEEGGEGSAVSVPITYDILNWYFNDYLQNYK